MNNNDKKETLADILAEMRKQANEPTIESLGEVFPPVGTEDVKDWAARIEAAAKREREAAEARQLNECVVVREEEASEWRKRTGNAAAMREALEKIRFELNAYCDDCTLLSRMTEDPPDYTCLRDSLLEIERIVSAALDYPARKGEQH